MPLHRIFVHSDLVTGFFTVGVRAGFPIEGIEVIIGNDIAGGKVFPVPRVVSNPHEHLWAGHLGISKTYNCRTCQVVGKPNQPVPPAPLQPIPVVGEPFEHVMVDCVGQLPKTKAGNQFLLTMMCVATRFPEAIPLRRITAVSVTKALVKFFTKLGLPKVVQTDQGTNFLSKVFKQTLSSLGIAHSVSSAYHPESQGALERWHQMLKSMLKKYCHETCKDWDEGVPFVLFAARDTKQESLGFSPVELVLCHNVRGPLKMLREKMVYDESPKTNVLDFVSRCKERLHRAVELARESLSSTQTRMKRWFDKKAVERQFNAGDKVLVLLPVPGSALTAKFSGPYDVERKFSETDYIIRTPDHRRKTRLCHVNMLKLLHSRDGDPVEPVQTPTVAVVGVTSLVSDWSEPDLATPCEDHMCGRLANSEFMATLVQQLSYLPTSHFVLLGFC
ncbi:hypothetical protein PO909_017780 [Leuciscus waleckii]